VLPHVGFQAEEGLQALCLQGWALLSAAGLAGVDCVTASAATEASAEQIELSHRAAAAADQ